MQVKKKKNSIKENARLSELVFRRHISYSNLRLNSTKRIVRHRKSNTQHSPALPLILSKIDRCSCLQLCIQRLESFSTFTPHRVVDELFQRAAAEVEKDFGFEHSLCLSMGVLCCTEASAWFFCYKVVVRIGVRFPESKHIWHNGKTLF